MIYRPVGNTGMNASIVGLGAEHLDKKTYEVASEVIEAAIENEMNIMDVFMPGEEVRQNISKALKGRRNKFLLQAHVGSVDLTGQYDRTRDVKACRKYFEDFLRIFKTDYVDFGLMFYIDTEKDFKEVFETGYIDYVRDLKKEGKIRAVGASSHDPKIAKRVVETGEIEMMMFSINPAFDMTPATSDVFKLFEDKRDFEYKHFDNDRYELYSLCDQKGIGITVMKTLGAGLLLTKERSPFEEALSIGQCIHYALSRPAVASALIGCQTRKQVEEAVNYINLSDDEKDYAKVIGRMKESLQGKCFYCNHCLPCPSKIDVAALTKYLDIARLDLKNIPPSIVSHYESMEHHANECIECGSCERNCPFGVKIIENMREAKTVFGL